MILEKATYKIIMDNKKKFKYQIRIIGHFEGTIRDLDLFWAPGYNTPESVLKLAKTLCGEL